MSRFAAVGLSVVVLGRPGGCRARYGWWRRRAQPRGCARVGLAGAICRAACRFGSAWRGRAQRVPRRSDFVGEFVDETLQTGMAKRGEPRPGRGLETGRQLQQLRMEMVERVARVVQRTVRGVRIGRVV